MRKLDDFRLRLGGRDYVPLLIGGMGVDISTSSLALEAARLGGIGHLSDAMIETVADRHHQTRFVAGKIARLEGRSDLAAASALNFDLAALREATLLHVGGAMRAKRGPGAIFVNVMEKLTMRAPRETLKVRLEAAMDAGIDGITLSAGLHLGSFELISEHPRFRDVQLGVIVSSVRALEVFLRRAKRSDRLPDYVVVEGPLAGGHLGFGLDEWQHADLHTIVAEVAAYLERAELAIPVVAAGGIFTGRDAVGVMQAGAAAVQVATRFTITPECGLSDSAKLAFLMAENEDVVVNTQSPTGYPMRMLRSSPAIGSNIRPNCAAFGYLLDAQGSCRYQDAWERTPVDPHTGRKAPVLDKTCLCSHMAAYRVYTCGATVTRLKDTALRLGAGAFLLPSAEHVFRDYQFSQDQHAALPSPQARPGALAGVLQANAESGRLVGKLH